MHQLPLFFLIIILSLPSQAFTLHRLFQELGIGAPKPLEMLSPFSWIRKKNHFQEDTPLENKNSRVLEEEQPALSPRQIANFDWKSFEELEKEHEQNQLSLEGLKHYHAMLLLLQRFKDHHALQNPRQQQSSQKNKTPHSLPDIYTAGCGSSAEKSSTSSPQNPSRARNSILSGRQSPLKRHQTANATSETIQFSLVDQSGTLDLNNMVSFMDLLETLQNIDTNSVKKLILSNNDLSQVKLNLSVFSHLKTLALDHCHLQNLNQINLPAGIESLLLNNNQFENMPDLSVLTQLHHVNLSSNNISQFPIDLYNQLARNHVENSKTELYLDSNPIQEANLNFPHATVTLHIDNHPGLVASIKDSLRESVHFSQHAFPNEILRNGGDNTLYLGEIANLRSEVLDPLNITRIVNCANDQNLKEMLAKLDQKNRVITHLNLEDSETQNINLKQELQKVLEALREGNTLVNCWQGKSRSATIVIGYLMLYEGKTLIEAYNWVKERRPVISPNENFLEHLIALELELQPDRTLRNDTPDEAALRRHFVLNPEKPLNRATTTLSFITTKSESDSTSTASPVLPKPPENLPREEIRAEGFVRNLEL